MSRRPISKSKRSTPAKPLRRANAIRVSPEVARRLRDGHPWIFEEALRGRELAAPAGSEFDVLDSEGTFVGRALYAPSETPLLRVFTRDANERLNDAYVARMVTQAQRWRRSVDESGPTDCGRVLAGECEGIPAVNVDRYANYLVVTTFSSVTDRYLDVACRTLQDIWQPSGIYLQRRHLPTGSGTRPTGAELVAGAPAPPSVVVSEGRARFLVDVTAPLGTGLFADMRLGRRAVSRLAPGRKVLNCFSYTGAFSLVAALYGAHSVMSVDSSPRAHTRARANFAENGLDAEDKRFAFIAGDALAVLERLRGRGERFGLVILDPPTFSTAKSKTFTAMKDYAELAQRAFDVLEPGGYLCAASNAAKFSGSELDRALARGASLAGRAFYSLERLGQPPDYPARAGFPESCYLKVVLGVSP